MKGDDGRDDVRDQCPYHYESRRVTEDPDIKECPECTSDIPIKARRCPQCTAELAAAV